MTETNERPEGEDVTDEEAAETAHSVLDGEASGAEVTTAQEVEREPAAEQDTAAPVVEETAEEEIADNGDNGNGPDEDGITSDVDLAGQLKAAIIAQDEQAQADREAAAALDGLAAEKVRSDVQAEAAAATKGRAEANAAAKLQARIS